MRDLHDLLIAGRLLGGSGGSPAPQPALITKNITANGTYSAADDSADGYSSVTINVPQTYTLFQPDISSYTSGTEVSNLGVAAAPITATNVTMSNNRFQMTARSKLRIPCNPIAYKKCYVSFKISNFTSPNGSWSNFFGFIGIIET